MKRNSTLKWHSKAFWLEKRLTRLCVSLPCFYDAPLHKGLLYNLDDGTTLQIRPILNEEGEPELLIKCVTEESVETIYQRGSNYD